MKNLIHKHKHAMMYVKLKVPISEKSVQQNYFIYPTDLTVSIANLELSFQRILFTQK
jgi:hypothetical protein